MPSTALIFSNFAGQLTADPAGLLHVVWSRGPRTLADVQALFEQMLLALRQRGWSRILIDQLAMPPFNGPEQVWIAADWLPRAVREGGYRHGAVVVSSDVLARLATAYVTANVQGLPLQYRSFDTEAEARAWLLRQPAHASEILAG